MKIKATQKCSDCHRTFEFSFSTDDVEARITNGGGVEIRWPVPDPPENWDYDFGFHCPEHARRISR